MNTEIKSICFLNANQWNDNTIIGFQRNSPDIISI